MLSLPFTLTGASGGTLTFIEVDGVVSIVARQPDGTPAWSLGAHDAPHGRQGLGEPTLTLYGPNGRPVVALGLSDQDDADGYVSVYDRDGRLRARMEADPRGGSVAACGAGIGYELDAAVLRAGDAGGSLMLNDKTTGAPALALLANSESGTIELLDPRREEDGQWTVRIEGGDRPEVCIHHPETGKAVAVLQCDELGGRLALADHRGHTALEANAGPEGALLGLNDTSTEEETPLADLSSIRGGALILRQRGEPEDPAAPPVRLGYGHTD